jgi:hypothetical protein
MRKILKSLAVCLAAVSAPASAERITTLWHLVPVNQVPPTSVGWNQPFFEQRLLPVRLVRTTVAGVYDGKTLAAGTYLYLVFNDDRQIGYCTLKDRSLGHASATLFIPILDQRPCFVDEDNDGKFEKSFSVFDKYGGPPTVRGSIKAAKLFGGLIAFSEVDPAELPYDLRVSMAIRGKRDPGKARVSFQFSKNLGAQWYDERRRSGTDVPVYDVLNAEVRINSVSGETAEIAIKYDPDSYVMTDNRNTLYGTQLPAFLRR